VVVEGFPDDTLALVSTVEVAVKAGVFEPAAVPPPCFKVMRTVAWRPVVILVFSAEIHSDVIGKRVTFRQTTINTSGVDPYVF